MYVIKGQPRENPEWNDFCVRGWELWNVAMESERTKRENLGQKVKPSYLYI